MRWYWVGSCLTTMTSLLHSFVFDFSSFLSLNAREEISNIEINDTWPWLYLHKKLAGQNWFIVFWMKISWSNYFTVSAYFPGRDKLSSICLFQFVWAPESRDSRAACLFSTIPKISQKIPKISPLRNWLTAALYSSIVFCRVCYVEEEHWWPIARPQKRRMKG